MFEVITAPDFSKKQIVFVMFNEGEKLAFSNDNIIVKTEEGKIKFQCTCYRLFIVFAVGHTSITSALIEKTKKFGFYIALMSGGFRLYDIIGARKEGNTLLRKIQYSYYGLGIAKVITYNKINNQLFELKRIRNKNEQTKEAISLIKEYKEKIPNAETLSEIMAYEGLSSKVYFRNYFNNVAWKGRQPRIKRDYVNSALDIGYTLLFAFIDALLSSYGFDTYCGVMHRQFYMRKSLVCDMVEPFRPLIDHALKIAINLGQIKEEQFTIINGQYRVKWKESAAVVKVFMKPILENKDCIFAYIQAYYRAFMKGLPPTDFPTYDMGDL